MIVIVLRSAPPTLRGDLTKWCQEIAAGVYVGKMSARVRDKLWQRVCDGIKAGVATMAYPTANEQGYTIKTTSTTRQIVDLDGVLLAKMLHRSQAIDAKRPIVAIDFETTGLNPSRDQIISMGAIKLQNENRVTLNRLVKLSDNVRLPKQITQLTQITSEVLENNGIQLRQALTELREFCAGATIVGYNINFDRKFLNEALIKYHLPPFENKMVDILGYVRKVESNLASYHLEDVLDYFGIAHFKMHNALGDAMAAFDLTQKLMEIYGWRPDENG